MPTPSPAAPRLAVEDLLAHAAERWNHVHRQIWQVELGFNLKSHRIHKEFEDILFDGRHMLKAPGPFKRLAAYAVLSQYIASLEIKSAPDSDNGLIDADLAWGPRATLWGMMHIESLCDIGGLRFPGGFSLPTPHFQLEFLAYLRNLRLSVREQSEVFDLDEITERIVLLGLMTEACTYATVGGIDHLKPLTEHAAKCGVPMTQIQKDDLLFTSGEYLENCLGIGLD